MQRTIHRSNKIFTLLEDIFCENSHKASTFETNYQLQVQKKTNSVQPLTHYYHYEKSLHQESPYIIKFTLHDKTFIELHGQRYSVMDSHVSVYPHSTTKANHLGAYHHTLVLKYKEELFKVHLYFSEKGDFKFSDKVPLKPVSQQNQEQEKNYYLSFSEINSIFRHFIFSPGYTEDFMISLRLIIEEKLSVHHQRRLELDKKISQVNLTDKNLLDKDFLSQYIQDLEEFIEILKKDHEIESVLACLSSNASELKKNDINQFSQISSYCQLQSLLQKKEKLENLSLDDESSDQKNKIPLKESCIETNIKQVLSSKNPKKRKKSKKQIKKSVQATKISLPDLNDFQSDKNLSSTDQRNLSFIYNHEDLSTLNHLTYSELCERLASLNSLELIYEFQGKNFKLFLRYREKLEQNQKNYLLDSWNKFKAYIYDLYEIDSKDQHNLEKNSAYIRQQQDLNRSIELLRKKSITSKALIHSIDSIQDYCEITSEFFHEMSPLRYFLSQEKTEQIVLVSFEVIYDIYAHIILEDKYLTLEQKKSSHLPDTLSKEQKTNLLCQGRLKSFSQKDIFPLTENIELDIQKYLNATLQRSQYLNFDFCFGLSQAEQVLEIVSNYRTVKSEYLNNFESFFDNQATSFLLQILQDQCYLKNQGYEKIISFEKSLIFSDLKKIFCLQFKLLISSFEELDKKTAQATYQYFTNKFKAHFQKSQFDQLQKIFFEEKMYIDNVISEENKDFFSIEAIYRDLSIFEIKFPIFEISIYLEFFYKQHVSMNLNSQLVFHTHQCEKLRKLYEKKLEAERKEKPEVELKLYEYWLDAQKKYLECKSVDLAQRGLKLLTYDSDISLNNLQALLAQIRTIENFPKKILPSALLNQLHSLQKTTSAMKTVFVDIFVNFVSQKISQEVDLIKSYPKIFEKSFKSRLRLLKEKLSKVTSDNLELSFSLNATHMIPLADYIWSKEISQKRFLENLPPFKSSIILSIIVQVYSKKIEKLSLLNSFMKSSVLSFESSQGFAFESPDVQANYLKNCEQLDRDIEILHQRTKKYLPQEKVLEPALLFKSKEDLPLQVPVVQVSPFIQEPTLNFSHGQRSDLSNSSYVNSLEDSDMESMGGLSCTIL